jgi:hypothetical protein
VSQKHWKIDFARAMLLFAFFGKPYFKIAPASFDGESIEASFSNQKSIENVLIMNLPCKHHDFPAISRRFPKFS